MSLKPSTQITPESKLPKGAWLIVAVLFFAGALNYIDRITITTMRESILVAIPMSETQFGLLTSVFLWTYGLLSPFAGFLADRFRSNRIVVISIFLWSVVTWLTAYSTTFGQLLTTRILMALSEALYIPAGLVLVVNFHQGSTRSLATGITLGGVMLGSSLGFIGGWIAEKHDWNTPFIIFGIVGIIYSVVAGLLLWNVPQNRDDMLSEKTESKVHFLKSIKNLLSQKSYILIFVSWGLLGVVAWMTVGWLPTYYKEHFNLSQGMAGLYATGLLYGAGFFGLIIGGFLADRWSRINPRGRIFIPVIGICVGAPAIFIASNTTVLPIAVILFMVFALTRFFVDANMMPILCMIVDSRYRATGYGVLNFIATIIGGIGIYAAGVLRDLHIDLSYMFKFASLLMLICAVLLIMVKPKSMSATE